MEVTYIAKSYKPDLPISRYVRRSGDGYFWCEMCDGWDVVRQGTADADDVPDEIRAKADAIAGTFPSYVQWPLGR
jgi:hypothetical protein